MRHAPLPERVDDPLRLGGRDDPVLGTLLDQHRCHDLVRVQGRRPIQVALRRLRPGTDEPLEVA